jgi:uncharacterized HAD superfamily protein
MSKEMNIALDIDEVLLDLLGAFILYHNDNHGTTAAKKDFFSYNFWEVLGGTKEEMIQKVSDFYNTPYFLNGIQPLPGAQAAVKRLAKRNKQHVITARANEIEEQTKSSLQYHFPHRFASIELTNQWFRKNNDKPRMKSSVCLEKNVELIVEDSLMHAYDCAAAGITVLLMDMNYGWNQSTEKLSDNIIRVHSWEEAEEEIERYGRERHRR